MDNRKKSELKPTISGAAPIDESFELEKIAFGKKKTEVLTNDSEEEESVQPSKKHKKAPKVKKEKKQKIKPEKVKKTKEHKVKPKKEKEVTTTTKKKSSARKSTVEELEPQFEFKKHDKYSTKGFIFLHGQDKETAKRQSPHYALPNPEAQQAQLQALYPNLTQNTTTSKNKKKNKRNKQKGKEVNIICKRLRFLDKRVRQSITGI